MTEQVRAKLEGLAHSLEVAARILEQKANSFQYEVAHHHTEQGVGIAWTELEMAMGEVRRSMMDLEQAHGA